MNQRRSIHTTLCPETYDYFKKIQDEHDCNLNEAMDICVQRNVTLATELKKDVLDAVINEVLLRYLIYSDPKP